MDCIRIYQDETGAKVELRGAAAAKWSALYSVRNRSAKVKQFLVDLQELGRSIVSRSIEYKVLTKVLLDDNTFEPVMFASYKSAFILFALTGGIIEIIAIHRTSVQLDNSTWLQ